MIPKNFHWVWLGKNPLPPQFKSYILTWIYYNPGFKCFIWNEKNLFALRNQTLYEKAESYSERSDIIRYEALHRYGGIYLDTDFECYAPMDEFLNQEVLLSFEQPGGHVATAIIGAEPQHSLMEQCISRMSEWYEINSHTKDPSITSGPAWLSHCWQQTNLPIITDTMLFFPYLWHQHPYRDPRSVAAHHWTLSWKNDPPVEPISPLKRKSCKML